MFGKRKASLSSSWCNVSGKQDGQRALMHPLSVTWTGDGGYSYKCGKKQNRGRKEQADGEEEVLKTGREQLFLGESRKDFALRNAGVSYFCTDFKVHRTQPWKLHVVFLAGNINIPYGQGSVWALQYCLDLILMYFRHWTCLGLYVLFFWCTMGENQKKKTKKSKKQQKKCKGKLLYFELG